MQKGLSEIAKLANLPVRSYTHKKPHVLPVGHLSPRPTSINNKS
jgi:hypothetical protein